MLSFCKLFSQTLIGTLVCLCSAASFVVAEEPLTELYTFLNPNEALLAGVQAMPNSSLVAIDTDVLEADSFLLRLPTDQLVSVYLDNAVNQMQNGREEGSVPTSVVTGTIYEAAIPAFQGRFVMARVGAERDQAIFAEIHTARGSYTLSRSKAKGVFRLRELARSEQYSCGVEKLTLLEPKQNIAKSQTSAAQSMRTTPIEIDSNVQIDIGVAYTPEARSNEGAGTTNDMLARLNAAIVGANQIYANSGVEVSFNLLKAVELPFNNSSNALQTISDELGRVLEYLELDKAYGADTTALVTESMLPGAYALIPNSPGAAGNGGSSYFGRVNFSSNTFAHENGHTLGSLHHRPDQYPSDLPQIGPSSREYSYGDHFIGQSGTHYRTLMSDLINSVLAPPGPTIAAQSCDCISGAATVFDGSITGDAAAADNVKAFGEYAPFLAGAETAVSIDGNFAAYAPWNGFLNQTNILELVNTSDTALPVVVEILTTQGFPSSAESILIPARGQHDLIVNEMFGFDAESYGLIKVLYDSDDLIGRLMRYRSVAGSSDFEFVFSIGLTTTPLSGTTNIAFNTFVPSLNADDQANTILNWINIINLSPLAKNFTVRRYNLAGALLTPLSVSVPPRGRVDIDGGHGEGPNVVGYNEIVPDDTSAPYMAQLVRYGSRPDGNYSFAFPLFAKAAGPLTQWVGVSSGGGAQNWLELQNTSGGTVSVDLNVYDNIGGAPLASSFELAPRSGRHIDVGSLLSTGSSGAAEITSSVTSAVVAQSMFYFRNSAGSIEAMSGRQSSELSLAPVRYGTWNLFLGMDNWLRLFNADSVDKTLTLTIYNGANPPLVKSVNIAAKTGSDFALHDTAFFGTSRDFYGTVSVAGTNVLAEILRIKPSTAGGFQFVTPTDIR